MLFNYLSLPLEINTTHKKKPSLDKENLVKDFKLPIQYLEDKYIVSDIVSTDLELDSCQNEKQKSMYHYLFKPQHTFAEKMIPEWKKYYTTNIEYLNDTKSLLENMRTFKEKQYENPYALDCAKISEIWGEMKHNGDFLNKYNYIDWDILKEFNKSTSILQIISFLNIASPILSFILPFFLLLIPFIILKIQSIPITFSMYLEVLKDIARHHFIGKALSLGFTNMTFDKFVYLIFILGFYLLQIYQNISTCYRMYDNINRINDYLFEIRNFIKYSVHNMDTFLTINANGGSYSEFHKDILRHREQLIEFYNSIVNIRPFSLTFDKFTELGYLLKCFYELHSNELYEDSLVFAFGFEGYINNLLGVYANLENKIVSYADFDENNYKCKFTQQYYPPLMEENPVKNDCNFDKNMIISSPNAGGKTTMIKTTTINVIFSQQLGCGFYKSCVLKPYTHIHSYLNIPDTSGRDSLFQAESRRCKEIIDIINGTNIENTRHFCIFDELYSGTNPKEATKSAYAFLLYLSKFKNVNFMLTTHYVDICKKFKKSECIQNYKMLVENQENGSLKYTYKMKKGISKIQGAIKILEQMNYPNEIIDSVKCFHK